LTTEEFALIYLSARFKVQQFTVQRLQILSALDTPGTARKTSAKFFSPDPPMAETTDDTDGHGY